MRPFIALIHKDADSDYGVSFPDLPGCITAGATLDEARAMAAEALALHLEGLAADGDPVPDPSSLQDIMSDAENRDGVAILVDPPKAAAKAIRLNITLALCIKASIRQTLRSSNGIVRIDVSSKHTTAITVAKETPIACQHTSQQCAPKTCHTRRSCTAAHTAQARGQKIYIRSCHRSHGISFFKLFDFMFDTFCTGNTICFVRW